MKKYLTQFLYYGTLVDKDGVIYENLENPKYGEELDTIRVVRYDNAERYRRLRLWHNNKSYHYELTKEEVAEMESYVMSLPYTDVEPADNIRFIDGKYNKKFIVKNLSEVMINGCVNLAVYIDEYHTALYHKEKDGRYTCSRLYHICEMGEIADRNGWVMYPVEKEAEV